MNKTVLVLFIVFISACTATKLVEPSQVDADRGAQKFQGYSMSQLNEGKTIYLANCNKCHRYKVPPSRREAKWDKIIPKMAKKAKLDDAQEKLVLEYVVTMSTSTAKAK